MEKKKGEKEGKEKLRGFFYTIYHLTEQEKSEAWQRESHV
jgi:hypothetical protein